MIVPRRVESLQKIIIERLQHGISNLDNGGPRSHAPFLHMKKKEKAHPILQVFLNNKLGTIVELLSLLEEDHVVGVSERGQCRRVRDEEKKRASAFYL